MREYYGEIVLKDSSWGSDRSGRPDHIFSWAYCDENKKETFLLQCCTPVSEVPSREMPARLILEPP
jgi:hemolysin-activating ACP:hemolysin acyltransferase